MKNELAIQANKWVKEFQQKFYPVPQDCQVVLDFVKQVPNLGIAEIILQHFLNHSLKLRQASKYEEAMQVARCIAQAFNELCIIYSDQYPLIQKFASGKALALLHLIISHYYNDNQIVTIHTEGLINDLTQHISRYNLGDFFYHLLYKDIPYPQLDHFHRILPRPKEQI